MATKTITVKNDVTVKVTTSVQTFTVTFEKPKRVYYKVTWTSGGLGTAPEDLAKRRDAYTYTDVPYGAQYKVEFIGAGSYTAADITGTVTGNVTLTADEYQEYSDYDNSCGCGNE